MRDLSIWEHLKSNEWSLELSNNEKEAPAAIFRFLGAVISVSAHLSNELFARCAEKGLLDEQLVRKVNMSPV